MANITVTPGLGDWSGLGIASGDTIYVHQGKQQVTAGVDLSTKNRMVNVYFGPDTALTFTTALKLGVSGVVQVDASGGKIIVQAANTGTGANTLTKLLVRGQAEIVDSGGGTWTTLEQSSGDITVAEGTIVTTAKKSGGYFDVGYNATAITTLEHTGGTGDIRRSITTGTIAKGSMITVARDVITSTSSITATTLNVYSGRLDWYGGAITTLNLYSPDSVFRWQDMRESVTIGTIAGHAAALARSGLTAASGGTLTSRFGATLTCTTVTPSFGGVSEYLGGDIPR